MAMHNALSGCLLMIHILTIRDFIINEIGVQRFMPPTHYLVTASSPRTLMGQAGTGFKILLKLKTVLPVFKKSCVGFLAM
jgi:hypothetical protein